MLSSLQLVTAPPVSAGVYQENGVMTGKCFDYWCVCVIRTALQARRQMFYYHSPDLVILNGFGQHNSDCFHDPVDNVILHFMLPHTSDQVQPLDLGVFAVQKRFMSSYVPNRKYSDQTQRLVKVLVSLERACVPPVVIGAFRKQASPKIILNETPMGICRKV